MNKRSEVFIYSMYKRSEVLHMTLLQCVGHARDVLQGLAGTCLGGGTPVMIGGVLRRRLQGPEESLSVINTCKQIMRKHC